MLADGYMGGLIAVVGHLGATPASGQDSTCPREKPVLGLGSLCLPALSQNSPRRGKARGFRSLGVGGTVRGAGGQSRH